MANLALRNIPDEILTKLRILSEIDKRSLNNEILIILEKGLEVAEKSRPKHLNTRTQISILTDICGTWEDSRSSKKIVEEIYSSRSKGRKINL